MHAKLGVLNDGHGSTVPKVSPQGNYNPTVWLIISKGKCSIKGDAEHVTTVQNGYVFYS